MIVQSVNQNEFIQAFDDMNRSANFSIAAREALFEYFENYSDETGEPYELDVIAICCEFTEYEDIREFQNRYGDEYKTLDDIEGMTTVIRTGDEDSSFVIVEF